jgi:hypothetical protein
MCSAINKSASGPAALDMARGTMGAEHGTWLTAIALLNTNLRHTATVVHNWNNNSAIIRTSSDYQKYVHGISKLAYRSVRDHTSIRGLRKAKQL